MVFKIEASVRRSRNRSSIFVPLITEIPRTNRAYRECAVPSPNSCCANKRIDDAWRHTQRNNSAIARTVAIPNYYLIRAQVREVQVRDAERA